jgi:hypothetical protein
MINFLVSQMAKEITYTCYQSYHQMPTGIGPETFGVNNDRIFPHERKFVHWRPNFP